MRINSISHNIVLTIVIPVIVVLLTLGILNYFDTKEILNQLISSEQKFITNEIESFVELQFVALDIIEEPIQQQMENYSNKIVNDIQEFNIDPAQVDLNKMRLTLGMDAKTYDLYVINKDGIVVNTTYANDLGINFFNFGEIHKNYLLKIFSEGIFDSPKFFFESTTKKYKKYSYQPTLDKQYIIEIGLYSNQADRIFDYMINNLNKIGEQRVNLKNVDLFFWLDTPTSLDPDIEFIPEHLSILPQLEESLTLNINQKNIDNTFTNYTYLYVKNVNSKLIRGAIVRILHDSEHKQNFKKKEILKFTAVLVVALLLVFVIYILIRPIGKIINRITQVSKELAIGDLSVKLNPKLKKRNDELGDLATAIDKLISGMTKTAEFARQTGKGKFNEEYHLLSDKDVLGKTLLKMQERLTNAKQKEEEAREEEKRNKFITDGLAKFGEILRSNSNNIDALSSEIIKNLVDFLEIPVGAIFVVKDDNGVKVLEAKATVAYGRSRLFEKRLKIGEGLVGRCAFEKLPIYMNEIPEKYLEITSGLGTSNPTNILLIPLVAEGNIFGVLELASFTDLEAHKKSFVEKLGESIASSIESVQTNHTTYKLLEQSKIQQEELTEQEEEMRQNMEELQATQEEAEKREKELANIIKIVDDTVFKVEYDMLGIITNVNEKYLSYLQVNPNDLIKKSHGEECKFLGINKPEHSSIWLKLKQGQPQEVTITIKVRNKKQTLREFYWPITHGFGKVIKISYLC